MRVLENISIRKGKEGYVLCERDEKVDNKDFIVYIESKRFSERTTLKSFAKAVMKKDIQIHATRRHQREEGYVAYELSPIQGSAFHTLVAQGAITVPEAPNPVLNI